MGWRISSFNILAAATSISVDMFLSAAGRKNCEAGVTAWHTKLEHFESQEIEGENILIVAYQTAAYHRKLIKTVQCASNQIAIPCRLPVQEPQRHNKL